MRAADDWPRTNRVLPWLLAAFLVTLWLTPFDAMTLAASGPIDLTLDRLVLGVIFVVWLCTVAAGGQARPRFRRSPIDLAILVFLLVAVLSVLVNQETLVNLGEAELSVKKLAQFGGFVFFFYLVATVVRPAEVRPFVTLTLGLACVAAIGTVYEYRTGTNLFYQWAADLRLPGMNVRGDVTGVDSSGRPQVSGPTGHGLAIATILAIALPFAMVRLMGARTVGRQLAYALVIAIVLAGALGTIRKSAAIVPAGALLVLLLLRPRQMLRLLPLGVLIGGAIHVIAPAAIGSVRAQLTPSTFLNQRSVEGRTRDYAIAAVDTHNRPLLGRGYGSYDPLQYRFLDNQYLMLEVEAGYLGLAAYLVLILSAVAIAARTALSGHALRAPPALAAAAAAVAFGLSNLLFDVLAFPHAPYQFFFVAGLAVVLADRRRRVAHPRPVHRQAPAVVVANGNGRPPAEAPHERPRTPVLAMTATPSRLLVVPVVLLARAQLGREIRRRRSGNRS